MVDENSTDKQRWYDDLSIIRWIFAIFGILIMLFTGGCSLFILSDVGNSGGGIVALIGGIPFLIGLIIWWLAAKVGRN